MFEFKLAKNALLAPLMVVAGAVEKKHTLPILSNILVQVSDNHVILNATDTEIEMLTKIECSEIQGSGSTTVPAKKLIDICRSFSDESVIVFSYSDQKVTLKQGRSRFKLSTLEADEFPNIDDEVKDVEFSIERLALIDLFQSTHFAMAHQDVRYYLNGLLLDMNNNKLTAVATDGHRLALSELVVSDCFSPHKVILPRKSIYEILRVLSNTEDEKLNIAISKNHFYLYTSTLTFITKLIEGRFPVYSKLIPKNNNKEVVINRDLFKSSLSRVAILANEKNRGVLLTMTPCLLTIAANNQEQEEAEESLEADTMGDEIKIGVNAGYLLDVLGNLDSGDVKLSFSDPNRSIFIESASVAKSQYIIMPVKI